MSAPIFSYHAGFQCIVYPHPQTGQPAMTKTAAVRAAGFKADDSDLARCLPRADQSIQIVPGSALDQLRRQRR